MALKSKQSAIGIILASITVVAAILFFGGAFKHNHHHHHHHGEMDDAVPTMLGDDASGSGIVILQSYARANGASAKAGAVFLVIKNFTDADDRLIGAGTDAAKKAALHGHTMDANGVMKMRPIAGGLAVPAHSRVELKRGGNHVMMMGLNRPLNQGDVISLTLSFENAGNVTVEVPVDLNR